MRGGGTRARSIFTPSCLASVCQKTLELYIGYRKIKTEHFYRKTFNDKWHFNTFEGGNLLFHLPSNCADAGKTGPSPLLRYCGNHHLAAPANANYHIPPKKLVYITIFPTHSLHNQTARTKMCHSSDSLEPKVINPSDCQHPAPGPFMGCVKE